MGKRVPMDGVTVTTFSLGPFETNAYVVINEARKHCLLIDAPRGIEEALDFINQQKLTLLYVVLTHGHIDHIEGLPLVDVPFYIHAQDSTFLQDPALNLSSFFSPFTTTKIPHTLNARENLPFDNCTIKVIHTPGHTPGSVTLALNNFLFTGDTLFCDSVGRTDFPYGSSEELLRSIKDKIVPLSKDSLIFPGHGPATDLQREVNHNPFLAECKYI
jgi:glyoxylase-like metal-dependent hydrolase (beta-lactamase superfamily II)